MTKTKNTYKVYPFFKWVEYMLDNTMFKEMDILDFEDYYQNLLPYDKNRDNFIQSLKQ